MLTTRLGQAKRVWGGRGVTGHQKQKGEKQQAIGEVVGEQGDSQQPASMACDLTDCAAAPTGGFSWQVARFQHPADAWPTHQSRNGTDR